MFSVVSWYCGFSFHLYYHLGPKGLKVRSFPPLSYGSFYSDGMTSLLGLQSLVLVTLSMFITLSQSHSASNISFFVFVCFFFFLSRFVEVFLRELRNDLYLKFNTYLYYFEVTEDSTYNLLRISQFVRSSCKFETVRSRSGTTNEFVRQLLVSTWTIIMYRGVEI